ncbi:MAG: hypothetical protein ACRD13_03820 [Terriglobales bacterium]
METSVGFEACLLACPLGALCADSAPGAASQWFTGVDSDVRTDLSDFPFREYSPAQRRWLSPEPGVPGAQRRALGWAPAGLVGGLAEQAASLALAAQEVC